MTCTHPSWKQANGKQQCEVCGAEGTELRYLSVDGKTVHDLAPKATRWDAIETLMILGDVELTQTEDGGYSIYVEPVENIVPQSWEGDTPDQAADRVVAKLSTPNAELSDPRPLAAEGSRSNDGLCPGNNGE